MLAEAEIRRSVTIARSPLAALHCPETVTRNEDAFALASFSDWILVPWRLGVSWDELWGVSWDDLPS